METIAKTRVELIAEIQEMIAHDTDFTAIDLQSYRGLQPTEEPPKNQNGVYIPPEGVIYLHAQQLERAELLCPGATAGLSPGAFTYAGDHCRYIKHARAWWGSIAEVAEELAEEYERRRWTGVAPFHELAQLSVGVGVVGPVVSRKLAADFEGWRGWCFAGAEPRWRNIYECFTDAFRLASYEGVVVLW
jgi:hypothetical protein